MCVCIPALSRIGVKYLHHWEWIPSLFLEIPHWWVVGKLDSVGSCVDTDVWMNPTSEEFSSGTAPLARSPKLFISRLCSKIL